MKEFKLKTGEREIVFNFPTSLDEITVKYLKDVTDHIHVADNYSLVGIVYHESIGAVVLARKQSKKSMTSGVVPVFIKAGNCDNDFIKSAKCKDKVIIASSQLSLGYHVVAPQNTISLDYFIRNLDKDNTIAMRYGNNYGKEECYFVEFKIIPNCDIVGLYSQTQCNVDNPYTAVINVEQGA